ncbi:MAG: metal-binding protein [Rhodobacterales bacterium 32-66-7]|nr:MAG: metal-binding protein [Rhodobacterales bacterium 12-65-15]OYX27064.1 MAG: metal-binding protein [Rhodobacterales bacterium 32-66-7]OYZ89558.1 MAG: metal-binding protein [Rhizobiales bacterium 17-65-6]
MRIPRRTLLLAGPFFIVGLGSMPLLAEADDRIHVVKDPGCPCCNGWIGHLRDNGFNVSFEERSIEDLAAFKRERGIPENLSSCHTATIGDYTIEGHVPAVDIRRLMAERPLAVGLSVPGMPFGSPGMGPETERQAYDVLLVGRDGSSTVFTSYPAA